MRKITTPRAQFGMSRRLRKQYTSSTRCINPGDPGCGGRGPKAKSNRQLRKEQDEISRRVDAYLERKKRMEEGAKRLGEKPSIVKREYIEGIDVGGDPHTQLKKPWTKKVLGENATYNRDINAKKGTKVKVAKRLVKAQKGVKTKSAPPKKTRKGLVPYEEFMRGINNMQVPITNSTKSGKNGRKVSFKKSKK